ncbi:hypothetical protein RDI61_02760 [Pseudomonas plecoglossicida]|jgi:hypothetical protein|uniref:hypothetical protein n=1 Tax=Pseudomonas TaxID=286 RepID=UPI000A84999E|nr:MULTISPECIES: hypothetical protein [Pseudomonas]MDQ7962971.1 hypothetical protein [Pseudomonas plecoglossicida]WBM49631.1 hypothetical protein M2J85_10050 [Pseudomonas putida]WFG05971.1 hypothetical protein P3X84_10545 [Pseudomonas putida]
MQQLGISGLDAAIRMTQDGDGSTVSSRSIWNCQEQQHAQTDECNQPKVGLRLARSRGFGTVLVAAATFSLHRR